MRAGTAVAVLLTSALLAGCGGDDEAQPAPSRPAATATPSATAAPKASAGPAKVAIAGFEYEPGDLTVEPGAKVTWVNEDASNHTVTFEEGPGDLGNVDENGKLSASFEEAGRYAYVCQYHPNMKGTITVR